MGENTAAPWTAWLQNRAVIGGTFGYPIALNPLGGNVGVNKTNPITAFDVAGTITAGATSLSSVSDYDLYLGSTRVVRGLYGYYTVLGTVASPGIFISQEPFGVSINKGSTTDGGMLEVAGSIRNGRTTSTNGFSSDGVHFTLGSTNVPGNGQIPIATGTGGAWKWADASGSNSIPGTVTNSVDTAGYVFIGAQKIKFMSDGSASFALGKLTISSTGALSVSNAIGAMTITLTNAPTFMTTNSAPAGYALGVTLPVVWFAITNSGNKYLIPGFTP
jgi:hypothetical protein